MGAPCAVITHRALMHEGDVLSMSVVLSPSA